MRLGKGRGNEGGIEVWGGAPCLIHILIQLAPWGTIPFMSIVSYSINAPCTPINTVNMCNARGV